MALFTSPPFYHNHQTLTTTAPTADIFPSVQNQFLHTNSVNFNQPLLHEPGGMKRRRGQDGTANEPLAKKAHYEDRMARRLDSLDLSNENAPLVVDDDLNIEEIDPEILDESSPSCSEDTDQPIIEEPDDDADNRIILSDELHRYMKSSSDDHILSKFHKKPEQQALVVWRPLPTNILPSSSATSDGSTSSINDRITEVVDDEDEMRDGIDYSDITFPDSVSTRSSSSPPQLDIDNAEAAIQFSSMSSSSSSSSIDDPITLRMSTTQNAAEEEPMEMD